MVCSLVNSPYSRNSMARKCCGSSVPLSKKPIYLALVPLLMTLFKVQFAKKSLNVFLGNFHISHIGIRIHFDLLNLNRCSGVERLLLIEFITVPCWFFMLLLYFQQKEWSSKLQNCSWLIQISFLSS